MKATPTIVETTASNKVVVEGVNESQKERRQHGTLDAGHAADDDDHEGGNDDAVPHVGRDGEDRRHQRPRYAGKAAGDQHRQGGHLVVADAVQRGRFGILGTGANPLPSLVFCRKSQSPPIMMRDAGRMISRCQPIRTGPSSMISM